MDITTATKIPESKRKETTMNEKPETRQDATTTLPDYGYLARYENVTQLVDACEKIRDAGYKRWDAYSPFAVHGIDPAMGIRPTVLPWLVLAGGLTGCSGAVLMQWWMNAVDYPYLISGKPLFSLPANIPVAFELTILLSALTAFFGVLLLNKLPDWFHPLFRADQFARATDDGFYIGIEARDPAYDRVKTRELLSSTNPRALELVQDESEVHAAFPKPVVYGGVIVTTLALIPLCFVLRAYSFRSEKPRIHPIQNMDNQTRFKPQQVNIYFTDGRAMRPKIEGSVATGESRLDDAYWRGVTEDGEWLDKYPDQLTVDQSMIKRGQERFNIYCSTCHGYTGDGKGMVHQRAQSLNQGTWVPPTNLQLDYVRAQPHGQLYNTITNGVRNMYGYGHLIDVEDRWAIVAYLRALQRSQKTALADIPDTQRSKLER